MGIGVVRDTEPGTTPIHRDDLSGLIPHITSRTELNEVEAENILSARVAAVNDRRLRRSLLTPPGLCRLHRMMFDRVWTWAGVFRTHDLNIGVDWRSIPERLALLCADVMSWNEFESYPWTERAIRFHHRLAQVHPFSNGNGRHARLAANLLLHYNGCAMLDWNLDRGVYISALRSADDHDYRPLLGLIRPLKPTTEEERP